MPTYQPRGGWGVSRLSPASLPASSHLGTDIALRLRLGWGTWCAASSWRHLLGLKWCRASQPPPEQEGTHYCPPTPWLAPGGIMLGTSALAVARVQLCLWPGAGTGWQLAVPCVWCWLCVQPCQALQPIVHPGATVQPVYPQPTHIWGEQPENSTAGLGSRLVPRGIPWDNRPWPLTSHEVSRLPLEPVWLWEATAGQGTPMLCSWWPARDWWFG